MNDVTPRGTGCQCPAGTRVGALQRALRALDEALRAAHAAAALALPPEGALPCALHPAGSLPEATPPSVALRSERSLAVQAGAARCWELVLQLDAQLQQLLEATRSAPGGALAPQLGGSVGCAWRALIECALHLEAAHAALEGGAA